MIQSILFLIIVVASVGCVKGGSGSNNTNNNQAPPNTTITSGSLSTNQGSVFLGLNNFSSTKTGTFTITNSGNGATKTITVSATGSSDITITETCNGKSLAVGESCSISYLMTAGSSTPYSFKKTLTISENGKSLVVPIYGYVYNFNEIEYMIEKIVEKQYLSSNNVSQQGSWNYNSNVSHISSQAVIIDALLSAKDFYLGNYTYSSLLTSDINFQSALNSTWKPLDLSLYFLAFNQKGTNSVYTDDELIKFNPSDVNSDSDTSFSKWNNSEYNKPKKISASVLWVINNNYKAIYGSDMPNWSDTLSKQLESRKLISVDGSNNISGSSVDIVSQLSYLLDPDRLNENSYFENSLKDVSFYFDYFNSIGDLVNLNKMAKFYLSHWENDFEDMQLSPLNLNLRYNPNEFNYTSFKKPTRSLTTLISDRLWWVLDYSNSSSACYDNSDNLVSIYTTKSSCESNSHIWKIGFSNTLACRDISYSLLNLVNSYNLGNLSSSEKTATVLLIQNGLLELKNQIGCSYDNSTKTFLSQDNGNSTYNENNGIAMINKIYHRLPDSIVSVDEKINSFNQLINELNPGGSLDLDSSTTNPLYLSEALKQLMELRR